MGEIIAVLSGKGGTGKTSLCAGTALALARRGNQVLCIDCDVGLRNLDISLGMADIGALSFVDVLEGGCSLDQAARHPDQSGLCFLTAPICRTADSIDPAAFGAMVQQARDQFDYVLLDASAGVDGSFHLTAGCAHRVMLVSCADPASVRDATRAAQLLELMGMDNVRLVLNRVSKKMYAQMALTVDDVMDATGLPLLGIVPEDETVPLAASAGRSVVGYAPRCRAARAYGRIAQRLEGRSVPVSLK